MLQVADEALKCAAGAAKTSNKVDFAFKRAIEEMTYYGHDCHPGIEFSIEERMVNAKVEDKSSLKVLKKLKDKFLVREGVTPLLRYILILIVIAAARGIDKGSRVSSPQVSS